jgi:GAF domain-containing protein
MARELTRSLDYHLTLRGVTGLVVPRLADWCMIFAADDGDSLTPRLVLAHAQPARERLLQTLWQRHPAELSAGHPIAACLRTGKPVLFAQASPEVLRSVVNTTQDAVTLAEVGLRSMLALPLVAHDVVLGGLLLAVARTSRRPYDEVDIQPLLSFAGMCAQALYNARLYREAKLAVRLGHELIGAVAGDMLERLAQTRASLDLFRWQSAAAGPEALRDAAPKLKSLEALVSEMEDLVRGLRSVAEVEPRR